MAGTGLAIADDPAEVAARLRAFLRHLPQRAKYYGVTLDPDGQPKLESVKRAAQERVIVQIQLA